MREELQALMEWWEDDDRYLIWVVGRGNGG